jgi:hypothetical protein
LQAFLNTSEQPQQYESAFARRRSGVRIPSAPLLQVLQKTGKSKDLGSPTGVLRTPVFTLVRYENASSMAATALCCMLGRTCRNKRQ